jgi:uncharacterized protein YndB with AHSA1/START domain
MPHAHDDHDEPTPSIDLGEPSAPSETDVVRRERTLDCPTHEAWSLLRDAEGLERWLADAVDLVVAPGEEGTMRDGDETLVVLVDEVEDGRRLALRWWNGDGEPSYVDLTLDPLDGERSRLVVTEMPLHLVSAPDAIPTSWTDAGGDVGTRGPQALALTR